MINPKLNQKFKEYLDTNLEPGEFVYFNNFEVKMDSSRGVEDAHITSFYYYDSLRYTGYVFETDLDPRDESTRHIFDLGTEDLMESEVRAIIKFMSQNHDKSREIAQDLTNSALKKMNENLNIGNTLKDIKTVFNKELELNSSLDKLNYEEIYDIIDFILKKVTDSDGNFKTNSKEQYFIDDQYFIIEDFRKNQHDGDWWDVYFKGVGHDANYSAYKDLQELPRITMIKVLYELLNNDEASFELNKDAFKKMNESSRIKSFKDFKLNI